LPQEKRQVFDLRFYGGLSIAEIAVQLDMTEDKVKKLWRNAKVALGELLQGPQVS
jgi:DNA-directed RNA polymerase specialized sigma24 family protein